MSLQNLTSLRKFGVKKLAKSTLKATNIGIHILDSCSQLQLGHPTEQPQHFSSYPFT